ncbi:hypothetical protein KTC96_24840 (plasmid) [Clostridium estertheticum]|uniref:hypothetical protein n=1 Tax=Clostridium estertheticum TaxID=238834 RepID=UPI001C7E08BF|nr:hypothetical protein [Clostridium estertheticum]MBX4259756.1 hypothetical protein [Clostridium estertheticum]WLC73251.1 hypothetical protein KTC96_24840 [Clostridium estertheticum]
MLFTDKEIKIYGLIQPNEKKMEKAEKVYKRLKLEKMMTFNGFYQLVGEEIQKININNVGDLEELFVKIKGYKKHRIKLAKQGKLVRCVNCIWRSQRRRCFLCKDDFNGIVGFTSKHDNDKCGNFVKRDIW